MTPAQIKQLRERMSAGRQPVTRATQYAHPRGWNDALDAVKRWFKEITGESLEPNG